MKKNNFYYILKVFILLVLSLNISAQTRIVSGIVRDVETQQPIALGNISLLNSNTGTTTDITGKFSISIPQHWQSPLLLVSFLGYNSDTIQVISTQNEYKVLLKPAQTILNEVVITGVSKATFTRENPIAIIAISSKKIEQTTESNIIDVLVKNVPGLNAVKTGPNISKPFIRGLGYNRVLTLYDGIRQEGQQWGDEHGIEVDAYNIEKGEVIKGPASLMYGSDAVAGVVSLMPAMPNEMDSQIHGKYFSEYQSNNGLIGNGLRLIWANSHWAYALSSSYRIAKNYTNNVDGRVYNTGFRETNAAAHIKYTGNNGYSYLNLTLYDNLQGIPDGSRDSLTRKFTRQIEEGITDDIKKRPIVLEDALNSYSLSPLHQHIQHYRIYSNNHYEFGKGDVDILLAFQQNIRREYNHPTLPSQAGMFVRLNTFNYGFRYNAPSLVNTAITIGINGMYQDNKNKNATDFPIPDYNLSDAGSFIFAKWKQNKWTLSGGIRYDIRYLTSNNFYTNINAITGFSQQVSSVDIAAYLQFPAFKKTFNGTSLSMGSTFQPSDNISLKVNVARGYRAPNITEFASNGLDPGAHIVYLGNRNFVPEFSLQEDIGADFHYKNVGASISVFNNTIQNYIYLSQLTDVSGNPVVDDQGNKTYQYQQASAQLYGLEATFNVHPSTLKGLSFDHSLALIYGYNRKNNSPNEGITESYLPLIPPIKLVSSISQEFQTTSKIFPSVTLKAEMDFNAAQNRYLALNNTETATSGYTLFNFSINTPINYAKNSLLRFQLQVNNVFDKAYQSNLSRLKYFEYYTNSPNGHLGMYGMGRNICLKAVIPF